MINQPYKVTFATGGERLEVDFTDLARLSTSFSIGVEAQTIDQTPLFGRESMPPIRLPEDLITIEIKLRGKCIVGQEEAAT